MAKNTIFWVIVVLLFSFTVFSGCTESFMGDDRNGGIDNSISQQNDGNDQGEDDNDQGKNDQGKNDSNQSGKDPSNQTNEPEIPQYLSAEIEEQIRRDFADWFPWHFETVSIHKYFGTYNGCEAVLVQHMSVWGWSVDASFAIADMQFQGSSIHTLIVWKPDDETRNGHCYRFDEAYELGLLSIDDIRSLHDKQYDSFWNIK